MCNARNVFRALLLLSLSIIFAMPARAQGASFDLSGLNAAAPGTQGNTTYKSGQGPIGATYAQSSRQTNPQIPGALPQVTTRGLAPIFGMGSGFFTGWYGADAYGGAPPAAYGGAPQPFTPEQLASLSTALPGSTFAQDHPRRTEVLENDANLFNQIGADQGALGSQTQTLGMQALGIADAEQSYAYQNGGYITQAQQAVLNQEEAVLGQEIASKTAINTGF